MKIIPLASDVLVSHADDMYKSLNADPDLPEVYIDVNGGQPLIIITEQEEMDILEQSL